MSQENVDVVRTAYEAFAREGLDRFMEHFTDDVEYDVLAGAGDLIHGPCHGKDAVRAYFQDWLDMFDEFWMELTELIDAGGVTVFTAERYGGRARLSGVETDSANWTVFTIRDGKIASGHEYETRDEALEAAGLSEWAMSQENVEMLRGLWEPFRDVDLTAVDWDDEAIREMTERFWSPEIELRWSRSSPEARVYRGRDGVIQAFREWLEPFSEYYNEPLDFIGVGDRVVMPNRQSGTGSTTGIPVESEFTWVHEIRDGQIIRVDEYDTLDAALEAAGLSE